MDPNAKFIQLAETEDFVEYFNRTLSVTIARGRNTMSLFTDIESLEVENLMDIRRYFRIAPGIFNGSGKYGSYIPSQHDVPQLNLLFQRTELS